MKNTNLKTMALLVLCAASTTALASEDRQVMRERGANPERFNEMKQKVLTNMQTRRSCVEQADSGEAMKKCRVHGKQNRPQ